MDMPAGTAALHSATMRPGALRPLLRLSLNAHAPFFAVLIAYYFGYSALVWLHPGLHPANFLIMALGFTAFSLPIMFIGLTFTRFYHIATVVKPERPIPALAGDLKSYLSDRARLAHGLPMVLIMILFMYVFVDLKANIPVLHPYAWDTTLAEWDKALHFGSHPWEWLQPVLGFAPITFLVNINYNAWFAVMWVVWMYFAFADKGDETRTRFFLAFFLAWIIGGGAMAVWFSSAGPCFYGRLGLSPDPFAAQMAYLHQVNETFPIWAVQVQDMLWDGLTGKGVVDGISAMPSMHNGTALLFALAGYKVSRPMGHLLAAHAVLIFIGSVHLAWHYAIDSYIAWALTLALWFGLAPMVRWWHGTRAQTDFDQALARVTQA